MIRPQRIFQDYQDSGAFNALVNIHAVIDDGMFLTKRGDLVMFLAVRGADDECLDPDEIDSMARRFESALRHLDERFRLYQYILKRESPPLLADPSANPVVEAATKSRLRYLESKAGGLYTIEAYWAVVYEGWRPKRGSRLKEWLAEPRTALRESLSSERTLESLDKELDEAREILANKVTGFAAQLQDFMAVEILDTQRANVFVRRLLNYAPFKADGVRLNYTRFVDFQACDSSLECHRDALRLDDYSVQVLTLKQPPARTFAGMLRGIFELSSNGVIATEWRREDHLKIRRLIQSKRRHFHNSKASLMNYTSGASSAAPKDMLIDDSALALVANLGQALEEIEVQGRFFGEFSLTIVLYDKDAAAVSRAVAQCFKIMAAQDAQLTEERYNRLNAWLSVLPGNALYNLRRLWLLSANYADLAFLHRPHSGNPRNEHLATEYLAVLEGRGGCPYYLNLHSKDVAHTLVLGATGSGKSFLLNFLVTHLQKYGPFTCIFDLGASYENLTRLFGGSYLAIGGHQSPVTINPFCLEPTQGNRLFLLSFVKVLIELNGFRMGSDEELDLYQQIENLYEVGPDQRRLSTLANILPRNLRQQLQKWVEGGPYARLFDNAIDNLTLARFQTFEFEGVTASDQLEPLLFYVLHRANAVIYDPEQTPIPKFFVLDEAWRFFRHPVIKAYIVEALKTWRKRNAAMILATQSSDDLTASEMLPVVVESCATKIFLANPGMDRDLYRNLFHLNDTETDLITSLIPKQQLLLKQPDGSKLLNLNVDKKEYWIYTNNPPDNQRKRDAFARYGFQEGLEKLARGIA